MSTRFICLVLVCFGYSQLTQAQEQNISLMGQGNNAREFVKHFAVGQDIGSFAIGVTGSTSDINWRYCIPTAAGCNLIPANSPITFAGDATLTFDNISKVIALTGRPTEQGTYFFTFAVVQGGVTTSRSYRFVIRDPLQIQFVVDRSGSMECGPNAPGSAGDWSACASDAPDKWAMASDAISQFANKMATNTNTFFTTDKVGIVYFDGAIGISGIPGFATLGAFSTGIVADFASQYNNGMLGRNGTGLGGGLKEAVYNRFNIGQAGSFRQVMIVISDGMQNVAPLVATTGANAGKILDDAAKTPLHNRPADSDHLDVYAIGLDPMANSASVGWVLDKITSDPANYFTSSSVGNYSIDFDDIFARVFHAHSPQLIDKTEHRYTGSIVSDTFQVNGGLSLLYFNVSFDAEQADKMDYVLTHDSDTISFAQPTIGEYSAMLTVDALAQPTLLTQGEWILYCRRIQGPVLFDAQVNQAQIVTRRAYFSATADEHQLKADYAITNDATIRRAGGVRVGTRLRPEVELQLRGQPLTDAVVRARLIRPNDDKGDLVARHPSSATVSPGSEVNNRFTAKYIDIATTDPAYLDSLRLRSDEILLTHQGGGRYTGRFNKLRVADDCSVVFTVHTQDTLLGTFQRYNKMTVASRFGELEHNLAQPTVTTQPVFDGYVHTLTYTPAYRVGDRIQLVGPGYENSFGAEAADLTAVADNGDGTYTLQVTTPERNTRPTLYLLDEPFYTDRPLTQFDQPYTNYPFDLSLHVGFSGPYTSFSSIFSEGGLLVEADLSYRLLPRLALEIIGGYYSYAPTDHIIGGGLHARYYYLANQLSQASVAAGIGWYIPHTGTGTLGYGLRTGVERSFTPRLRAVLDIGAYYFPKPDLGMGIISAGVKYGF